MSGLNLIQEYSSDSDDNDETEYKNNQNPCVKLEEKINKLPLPESISSWKGAAVHHEEVIDNPLEHDGRSRSFKHERGNWATLVYIDYIPTAEMIKWMKSTLNQSFETGNLFEEFHVSLTRTLILKFHWIDSFVEAVKSIVDSQKSFFMELNSIEIYSNEEKTRTFMGIAVQSEDDNLLKLTQSLDKVADEYQLPLFYENPSYHISFAWGLGDQRNVLEAQKSFLTTKLYDFFQEHPEERYLEIDCIKCKVGNKLFKFKLH
ncbi:U6 snRNA phosphodiesterase [Trichogramma pretiosum]|uniref:U6 snRNA phosphodiesterase n=1 Tax=Trichogramma pretiosum TaxID=7493 RepID=UPI0006C96DF5|nr:U6 snRNA phosphodiesterase [Trichogramma pretiosum]